MNENVRKDIISLLNDVVRSLQNHDVINLTELSNHIIHSASIYQDEYSISTAVIVFALSKITQRNNYVDVRIIALLNKAIHHLQKYQLNKYNKDIKKLVAQISKSDTQLDLYIQHVMDEANVKKASKIYEHGISLGQTAQLLGISQWELMKYVGNTKITDNFVEKVSINTRLKQAFDLFKIKA
jgi:predicted S18 family serine protease